MSKNQASLLLQKQLKDLCKNPVDGFSAGLIDEGNIFQWSVSIIGHPDTLYEGGFFNAVMSFPDDYPNSPPTVTFKSEMWHPNGVPLRRVNQAYVIGTSTKVDISGASLDKFDDKYFGKVAEKKNKKGEGDDQKAIDTALIKAIEAVPELKTYLSARFSLKQGMKPHELVF